MGTAGISGIYGSETSRFVPQMLTKAVSAPAVLKASGIEGPASDVERPTTALGNRFAFQ